MNKEILKELFIVLDKMFTSCQIDYEELRVIEINKELFDDYKFVRIVNSFLFNYSKIQDKMGAKLFRRFLYVINEIDNTDIPMIDILNILEKRDILRRDDWEYLREVRNNLAHEYPLDFNERMTNLKGAFNGFEILQQIYKNIKAKV